jgi:hypothetical protein
LVSLVEFLLNLNVLGACILEQRGETADTLSVQLEISEHFLSVTVGLGAVFRSVVTLDALHGGLHRDGSQLKLHFGNFFTKLIVLSLYVVCKNAGCPFVLQMLVRFGCQPLLRDLNLVPLKTCLFEFAAQQLGLLLELGFNSRRTVNLFPQGLNLIDQTRI